MNTSESLSMQSSSHSDEAEKNYKAQDNTDDVTIFSPSRLPTLVVQCDVKKMLTVIALMISAPARCCLHRPQLPPPATPPVTK